LTVFFWIFRKEYFFATVAPEAYSFALLVRW